MEFRLLGTLEVVEGGRPVSLGGSRARALLVLLLLHRNEVVTVDRIMEELWAERPPKTGGQVVRIYVSQLRKALEPNRSNGAPGILLTRRNGYLLEVEPGHVDVDRFEALRAEGHRLLGAGEVADAASTLEEALSLWRGAPLQDVAYEAFAQAEIARLEELHLVTLEDLSDTQLAAGRDSALVADLEQLVEANPLRERLRAQLMLAQYRAGRPADALETYQRGRRLMVDELGLEPGEPLRRLEAQILQQDSTLDRPTVSPPPAEPPARPAPWARRPRVSLVAAILLGAAAVGAFLVAATIYDGHRRPIAPSIPVALVLNARRNPIDLSQATEDPIIGMRLAGNDTGLRSKVLYGGGTLSGFLQQVRRAAGKANLVIVDAAPNEEAVSKLTRLFPKTHFVVFDSVFDRAASFRGQRNVTGLAFHDRDNAYVGGYLAALMTHGNQAVSAVGSERTQSVGDLIQGFAGGARQARPGIRVLVDYTNTSKEQSRCIAAANRQIDHGSHVVFDVAGECGFGTIQAAGTRNVWALAIGDGPSNLGPEVLATVLRRSDLAVQLAVKRFASGQLPHGQDLSLDLAGGIIGLAGISTRVPKTVRAKVAAIEEKLSARNQAGDSR